MLYSIYRTNWYRDNRLSYDAATIIIDKDYVIQIANIIDNALMARDNQEVLSKLKRNVLGICKQFPVYR